MIGMLLALVVLAAAFLGIRQYNKNASSAASTTEDTQETVLDVNSDDITSFSYVYEGETYAFEKEDETWYYADDHSLNLNQDRIKAMILKVAPLKADQVIENVTDMSQYGLADPERTIQYETADRSVIINIGNLNSMTSQYYIAFPSEMKVYVVATNVVTGFNYTLDDLVMTEYVNREGRLLKYPQDKKVGNEDVYNWLRENPHRLNLVRVRLQWEEESISAEDITGVRQELVLYEGILYSEFQIRNNACRVRTACHNEGRDILAFSLESEALKEKKISIVLDFPYGASDITASDWTQNDRHRTTILQTSDEKMLLWRQLDRDEYYAGIYAQGGKIRKEGSHTLRIFANGEKLDISIALGKQKEQAECLSAQEVMNASKRGGRRFWERGGIIQLNKSADPRARELERRIILSQYLMAINSSGSTPPQETGLTCNSWYGKMHLEMYLWHCAWLPLWHQEELLDRSLAWYREHLQQARENAARNGYKGARWPKMIATEGVDCPSNIAPLLVWQQPHIIYMLEMAYRRKRNRRFLEENWELLKETADFMVDFVGWDPVKKVYSICAPVIPVQECHKAMDVCNPAFEVEYFRDTLRIAGWWAERLGREKEELWEQVAEHMAELTEKDGVYLAHENCPTTFTEYNRDHPSMLGAFGLIDSDRIDRTVMDNTLQLVEECWKYPTLWGWDFAMMAMTAVRLGKPEKAIELLLKESPKNCYVTSGNNRQTGRKDLPLYLPGNGSLLLADVHQGSRMMDNGSWNLKILIHCRVRALSAPLTRQEIKCKIKLYAVK